MSDELDRIEKLRENGLVALPEERIEVLRGNVFGIYASADDLETKIYRMLSLVPMSLEVVDEARLTIQRLNEENERLRKELEEINDHDDD